MLKTLEQRRLIQQDSSILEHTELQSHLQFRWIHKLNQLDMLNNQFQQFFELIYYISHLDKGIEMQTQFSEGSNILQDNQ